MILQVSFHTSVCADFQIFGGFSRGWGGDSDLSEGFRGGGGVIVIYRSVFEGVGG